MLCAGTWEQATLETREAPHTLPFSKEHQVPPLGTEHAIREPGLSGPPRCSQDKAPRCGGRRGRERPRYCRTVVAVAGIRRGCKRVRDGAQRERGGGIVPGKRHTRSQSSLQGVLLSVRHDSWACSVRAPRRTAQIGNRCAGRTPGLSVGCSGLGHFILFILFGAGGGGVGHFKGKCVGPPGWK